MKPFIQFFKDLYNEPKLPKKDKNILLILVALTLIPNILAPELSGSLWGILYTLIIFSFIPDYFFNIVDHNLILSHYPFSMKSFNSLRRGGQFIAVLAPSFISNFLWEYKRDTFN